MQEEVQPRWALSRGVLVLDADFHFLKEELIKKRFKVQLIEEGAGKEERFQILIHRVFVTSRAAEFVYDAPVEEFSLIDAKRAAKDPKVVAGQISRAFVDLELRTKEPFLLILNGNRKPVLKLIY